MVRLIMNEFGDRREIKHGVGEGGYSAVGYEGAGGAVGRLVAGEQVESDLGKA